MTGRRSILIFWILLMIPALILAGIVLGLLSHEKERIRQSGIEALMDQARAAAGAIDLTVETVQNNLTSALLELPEENLEDRLLAWEAKNPLVRNVFIYHPGKGLEYPRQSMAATREERRFISRFSPLFSGEMAFDFNRPAQEGDTSPPSRQASALKRLYSLSRAPEPVLPQQAAGWIPWFSDNRLYILGWVQKQKKGPVYGMELELMTLLSRLVTQFPENRGKGVSLVLMDGSGRHILQSGEGPGEGSEEDEKTPDGRFMVSEHLPHWSMAVYAAPDAFGTGRTFMALSLALLGLLLTAIVIGGRLITRLAVEKMRDARQKTSFVASVSHELKTPLTSIRMYAELLQSKRVTDPEKQARYLDVIVGESSRLTRLINNVLDFGRLEQGRKTYRPARFDMTLFLEDLIRTHAIRIKDAGFDVIKEFPAGGVEVDTDRDALEQAVLNLLDNAIKYARGGTFIKFSLTREKRNILLRVQDNGPGVPDHARNLIFEKFFRADTSLTSPQPGSGLGLSISRQMIRDLGGDLYLEPGSDPDPDLDLDGGACFTIRIACDETD